MKVKKLVQTLYLLFLLLVTLALEDTCPHREQPIVNIGVMIDQNSLLGKQQITAMEMAVNHLNFHSTDCLKLGSLLEDSQGNLSSAVSAAIELIKVKRVKAVVGSITAQEANLISDLTNGNESFPFVSLNTPATGMVSPEIPFWRKNFFRVGDDVIFQTQCVTDLVKHFKWRRVSVLQERRDGFSDGTSEDVISLLSDSLRLVNSEIEHHKSFSSLSSLCDPEKAIVDELEKVEKCATRVLIVLQFSLESAILLFHKAKQLGRLEKGYVWIIAGEIADLLDSVDPSFKNNNMQGVIGIKTGFPYPESLKNFRKTFRRNFEYRFPEQSEENSNPSIFALRAYDAITYISRAKYLSENLLTVDFHGLSGSVNFEVNGALTQQPRFEIVNVVGNSYREVASWSPNESINLTGWIYWPGGLKSAPIGWSWSGVGKPLRIGVPASCPSQLFVRVSKDEKTNLTSISGFSINVFEQAVKMLAYKLNYSFVPFYGSYDEMVKKVYDKHFDAAVGDIDIYPNRYKFVDFSQPYVSSGIEMIVKAQVDDTEPWKFMKAFSVKMWLLLVLMHFGVCAVVWLIENQNGQNIEFHSFCDMLWFSVTIFFFAHRERIQRGLARLVLAPWLFAILVVVACFTASLASMLTVSRFKPSVVDVETLLRTNATVGCYGKGYVAGYLTRVLKFKKENIKRFYHIDEYPDAFERGDIKAAFLVGPHAKVFLTKYCNRFIKARSPCKQGGFGFVFGKGSPLTADISEAVVKLIGSGQVEQLERAMLSSLYCSSPIKLNSGGSIGTEPFSALFMISGGIAALGLALITLQAMARRLRIWRIIQAVLLNHVFWRWVYIYLGRRARRFRFNQDGALV